MSEPKNYKKTKAYKAVKASLIQQLEEGGNANSHFLSLVDDYMNLWNIKQMLIDDIEERGVSIHYQNGLNQWGYKKNDSVAELGKISGQMLKILQALKIKPKDIVITEDDEDEL